MKFQYIVYIYINSEKASLEAFSQKGSKNRHLFLDPFWGPKTAPLGAVLGKQCPKRCPFWTLFLQFRPAGAGLWPAPSPKGSQKGTPKGSQKGVQNTVFG